MGWFFPVSLSRISEPRGFFYSSDFGTNPFLRRRKGISGGVEILHEISVFPHTFTLNFLRKEVQHKLLPKSPFSLL